ncbi:MAG: A/G-specific adenine glycosylase [Bacteroidota bacterium]
MQIGPDLLDWYDKNRRSLPWRGSRNPYVIWISEIIFQQTRIGQGTSYFLRFIERFPDILSLALAEEDEVLRLWQGLGYYSRARNLMSTARKIMTDYNGQFPSDFKLISELKGIGDYTASCITSICFQMPNAAVDGNVFRVLSRLFADSTPINSGAGKKRFKELAQSLITPDRPGDFNEAMMDLGAMICTPRSPICLECPLTRLCKAYSSTTQVSYPVKTAGRMRSVRLMEYVLVKSDERILVRKRTGAGIWKGLYELPSPASGASGLPEISRIIHPLSHADLDIRFYQTGEPDTDVAAEKDLIWIEIEKISQYPFPKPLADFIKGNTISDGIKA